MLLRENDRKTAGVDRRSTSLAEASTPVTPFTYHASYPGISKPLKRTLSKRGLKPSLTKDPRCVFEFSQRTKACFERAHAHTLVTSNIFVHRGLADKARLARLLSGKRCHPSPTYVVRGQNELSTLIKGWEPTDKDEHPWCLKAASVNNSLGVAFYPSIASLVQRAGEFFQRVPDKAYIIQPYIEEALLYKKRKCHIRLNVLVVGSCGHVYVHKEPVLHVAPLEYDAATEGNYDNAGVHITNHVAHRKTKVVHGIEVESDGTPRSRVTLNDLEVDTGCPGFAKEAFAKMCDAVREVFQSVVGKGNEFLPAENCFELFGVDFLLKRSKGGQEKESLDFEAIVLEVNSGPGLEGRVDEILCEDILDDTLRIVLDPWHNFITKATTTGCLRSLPRVPFPECPNGYRHLGAFFDKKPKREGMKESPFLVSDAFVKHVNKVLEWTKTLDDTTS